MQVAGPAALQELAQESGLASAPLSGENDEASMPVGEKVGEDKTFARP
jgi:hypothetical protein